MRVLVTGSSGLLGEAIVSALRARGDDVVPFVRREAGRGEISWDPKGGRLNAADLAGADAVIHLAGENLAAGRWTSRVKREIRESRVRGTRLLAETLTRADGRSHSLVCASAVGFYGSRGDEVLDEKSRPGEGFLAEVCQAWEQAADPAREAGVRVVHMRFGVVFSPTGGALARMLPVFRLGLGGRVGSGEQWMSWVSLQDAVGAVLLALESGALAGPVNVVAPRPVRNAELTRVLGSVLRRPAVIPVPAPLLRLALGELADEALLASTRAVPGVLESQGYGFAHPTLEQALTALLE